MPTISPTEYYMELSLALTLDEGQPGCSVTS